MLLFSNAVNAEPLLASLFTIVPCSVMEFLRVAITPGGEFSKTGFTLRFCCSPPPSGHSRKSGEVGHIGDIGRIGRGDPCRTAITAAVCRG